MDIINGDIRIRSLTSNDYLLLYKWLSDDRVLEFYSGRDKHYTYQDIVDKYSKIIPGRIKAIIEYKGKPVGYCQIYRVRGELYSEYGYPESGEIVYAMDQFIGEVDYWNKGIGSSFIKMVFDYLKTIESADAVILDPHVNNPRAVKAYTKAGFRIIKDLPKHELHEGKMEDSYLMEYRFDDNLVNVKAFKYILKKKFPDLDIHSISVLGSGHDSVAYLVNDSYVFKIKYSSNSSSYEREMKIYEFLNDNLSSNIKIPKIEYSYIGDDNQILGYRKINGKFLTPDLYMTLSDEDKLVLKRDIASFLRNMHDLDYSSISSYSIDTKHDMLEKCELLLSSSIFDSLTESERDYIDRFIDRVNTTLVFEGRKCLCHNDFSCNHILLDDNNKLCGLIDFGDSGICDEYSDFVYLLEDSNEEIGSSFGEDVLRLYGDIDIDSAKEYQDIFDEYYPIEMIVYGIKNNREDFIRKGRLEILSRTHRRVY